MWLCDSTVCIIYIYIIRLDLISKALWAIYRIFDQSWWNGAVCMSWTWGWLFGHVDQHFVCYLIPRSSPFGVLALMSARMTSWLLVLTTSNSGREPIEFRSLNMICYFFNICTACVLIIPTTNNNDQICTTQLWSSQGTVNRSSHAKSYGATTTPIQSFKQKPGMSLARFYLNHLQCHHHICMHRCNLFFCWSYVMCVCSFPKQSGAMSLQADCEARVVTSWIASVLVTVAKDDPEDTILGWMTTHMFLGIEKHCHDKRWWGTKHDMDTR